MISNFTGADDRGHDRGDRNANVRHVKEIFTASIFEKLLKLNE